MVTNNEVLSPLIFFSTKSSYYIPDIGSTILIKVCPQLTNILHVAGKTSSLSHGDSRLHREAWKTTVRNGALPGMGICSQAVH